MACQPRARDRVGRPAIPSQLDIYNGALLVCGERFLAALTENVEPRRLLDREWAAGGIQTCLEEAQWHFAMRTQQLDYDPSIEPSFGYNRAFPKPVDWVLTSAVCSDDFFRSPLTRYSDEAGYWYSDLDTIYVKFVSNDINYGLNMGRWPKKFQEFVEAHFASKIILKLADGLDKEKDIREIRKARLMTAKSKDAMADPTMFPAQGAWSRSRNRFPGRRDGGNITGNLIG